jgi:multidrug resistance efflux pump
MPELIALEDSGHTDFVGREPGWIVRSGIGLLLLVFVLFLSLTWIIKYPDTIESGIRVAANEPPVDLVAKVNGQIEQVFISDGDTIEQGAPLLLIESDLDFATLQLLEQQLQTWQFSTAEIPAIGEFLSSRINTRQLGPLQNSFNQLVAAIEEYRIHLESVQPSTYRAQTESKRQHYQVLSQDMQDKLNNRKQKLAYEEQVLQKNQKLFKQGAASESDVFRLNSQFLDLEAEIIDIRNQKNNYDLAVTELTQELQNMERSIQEKRAQLINTIHQHRMALTNDINDWKQTYLISSPINGRVSFSQRLSQYQYISAGASILTVFSDLNVQVGQMVVQHTRSGKIKPGQDVFINLDSLPANEYGHLRGVVKSKALVPTEAGLLIHVELADPVQTDFGHELPQTAELYGNARIVTQERRLISRFFDQILSMLNK